MHKNPFDVHCSITLLFYFCVIFFGKFSSNFHDAAFLKQPFNEFYELLISTGLSCLVYYILEFTKKIPSVDFVRMNSIGNLLLVLWFFYGHLQMNQIIDYLIIWLVILS